MRNVHQIREVSTLSFNERVLQEAEDRRNPPMERLKFLGIFSSNMDEFFKVRVASVQRRIELGHSGMQDVLEVLAHKARELDERFRAAYADITSTLAVEGIKIFNEQDIEHSAKELGPWLNDYFRENVLPSLVPIIIRKELPFPQLIDGALYFGVKMWGEPIRYAILEIPAELPRFVELPNGAIMYVDDLIRHSLSDIFYIFDYERIGAYEFKISRDAQLDMDNDFSEGHVRKMERVLKQRKGGRPTRLVHDATMPMGLLQLLREKLKITKYDTLIAGARYHNMKDLMGFPNRRADLSFEEMEPAPHPVLDRGRRSMVDVIQEQDLLLTYPYQSFDNVIRLLREAAIDPDVEEIKMTLYRVARQSQVVNALINAARNGKKVFASIELQARFDEKNNIRISEVLTEAGATVVYGVPPMKVHCKLLLIKRKKDWLAGLSTGNFHEATGKLYVDSTLLTSDKSLAEEAERVFDYLDNASKMRAVTAPRFKHLLVSPFNARKAILKLINRELKKGEHGYILLKVNHLTDDKIIGKLREAADAGVKMDLVVRTTYAMLPHPNIRAISILDRFLEHQRIYIFGRGEDLTVYMSSADLMERNLDWRVEVAFPLYDARLQQEALRICEIQVNDSFKARILDEIQSNQYVSNGNDGLRAQYETHAYYRRLGVETPRLTAAEGI
ncbi:MAG TPA: polyphosphate kinase 1 [Candidatus Hydrogenedentes bacterium]|nr:polyphosphate kinase 1 [Candidatus Hydrogenedentota bacterium]HQH53616.1 polyphosphate kinase 1 [Candidatus Hydrogenedentota bacterium]HQM48063.1 polyphosphate kinase 1 [Candidatus Hydrogenedentota bacterium]